MKSLLLALPILTLACDLPPPTPSQSPDPAPNSIVLAKEQALLSLPTGAVGSYDATLIPFAAPKSWVSSQLPAQLELGPQDLTGPFTHPVFILHQTYVSVGQPGGPQNPGWHELSWLYFPLLKLKDGKTDCVEHKNGPFSYLAVMHVDSDVAIFTGNAFFGLNQHKAAITVTPTSYDVSSLDAAAPLTYHADFGPLVPLTRRGKANVAKLEAALSHPVLGFTTGTPTWHNTDWMFPAGIVTSVAAHVVATAPEYATLSPDSTLRLLTLGVDVDGLNGVLGGFHVAAPFESTIPAPCPGL